MAEAGEVRACDSARGTLTAEVDGVVCPVAIHKCECTAIPYYVLNGVTWSEKIRFWMR